MIVSTSPTGALESVSGVGNCLKRGPLTSSTERSVVWAERMVMITDWKGATLCRGSSPAAGYAVSRVLKIIDALSLSIILLHSPERLKKQQNDGVGRIRTAVKASQTL